MTETKAESKSVVQKIVNLDQRIIYTLLLIVLSIPILKPLGLPLPISQQSLEAHEMVLSLQPGDTVLIYSDTSAHGVGETGPGIIAFIQDVVRRPGVKFVVSAAGGFRPETPLIYDTTIFPSVDFGDKTYGEDYVNLGWTPGGETAMASFARDIHALYPTDHRGTPINDIPMMAEIKILTDFDVVVYAGGGNQAEVMRQIFTPSGKPGIQLGMAVHKPGAMAYYPETVNAYVFGMAQSGEYEILIDKPGLAVSASDSLSLSHLLLLAFLTIGNIAFFLQEKNGGKSL